MTLGRSWARNGGGGGSPRETGTGSDQEVLQCKPWPGVECKTLSYTNGLLAIAGGAGMVAEINPTGPSIFTLSLFDSSHLKCLEYSPNTHGAGSHHLWWTFS